MKHERLYELFLEEVESHLREEWGREEWGKLSDSAQDSVIKIRLSAIVKELARFRTREL